MKIFSLLDTQYKSFTSKVKNYISKTLSNDNVSFGSNTIFGQILTVVGSAMQNIMLYIEDALVEQNKYTAQRKKSIFGLAALSGYNPHLGKAAVANIKLSFIPNNEDLCKVIINNKEPLTCTQNGLKYNIILPQEGIILNPAADASSKYFSAVQGLFETQRFISQGGQYYTINFKYVGNVDVDYMTVKVNNEIWEYCASLYDMSSDGKQYTYKVGINGGIDLIFGNEAHGRALKSNDVVDVTYLIHDGVAGNLNPLLETYFVFDKTLNDTAGDSHDGNAMFNVVFAETDPILSGSNSETLEHARQMIGLNSRSLVLASPENYKVLINHFGFCGYNRTWSEPNSFVVNSMILKNFKNDLSIGSDYFNLTESDFILSDMQKTTIHNYIKNNGGQLATTVYNIFDPILYKYSMYVYVSLKASKYNKELISNQIRQIVGDFFANVEFDLFIPKSDLIHAIKSNVDGIDGIDIYFLSQKNEEAINRLEYEKDIYELNNVTGRYIKKSTTVKLYPGENPNLGLDSHGNIYLESDSQFPVIMGGWSYVNDENQTIQINDPLTIIFEE